jgi:hypothetical protein
VKHGELAQLVERVLSMHEVAGSIPAFSNFFLFMPTILELELFTSLFPFFGIHAVCRLGSEERKIGCLSLSASMLCYPTY